MQSRKHLCPNMSFDNRYCLSLFRCIRRGGGVGRMSDIHSWVCVLPVVNEQGKCNPPELPVLCRSAAAASRGGLNPAAPSRPSAPHDPSPLSPARSNPSSLTAPATVPGIVVTDATLPSLIPYRRHCLVTANQQRSRGGSSNQLSVIRLAPPPRYVRQPLSFAPVHSVLIGVRIWPKSNISLANGHTETKLSGNV